MAVLNEKDADVSIFLNRGDGSFSTGPRHSVGSSPFVIGVADVNGDDHSDLLLTHYDEARLSVHLGRGDGSFDPGLEFETGGNPSAIGVADLDGDDDPDLIVTNYRDSTLSVFENRMAP